MADRRRRVPAFGHRAPAARGAALIPGRALPAALACRWPCSRRAPRRRSGLELDVPAVPNRLPRRSAPCSSRRAGRSTRPIAGTATARRATAAGPIAETCGPGPATSASRASSCARRPAASCPTDEDLFRTVTLGSPGTAMPAWGAVLSVEERWQVIAYVKAFGDGIFEDEAFDPYATVIEVGRPAGRAAGVAGRSGPPGVRALGLLGVPRPARPRGRPEGRRTDRRLEPADAGDGPGDGLEVPRREHAADAYLRLTTGLDGTPMPSYAQTLSPTRSAGRRRTTWPRWRARPRAEGTGPAVIRAATGGGAPSGARRRGLARGADHLDTADRAGDVPAALADSRRSPTSPCRRCMTPTRWSFAFAGTTATADSVARRSGARGPSKAGTRTPPGRPCFPTGSGGGERIGTSSRCCFPRPAAKDRRCRTSSMATPGVPSTCGAGRPPAPRRTGSGPRSAPGGRRGSAADPAADGRSTDARPRRLAGRTLDGGAAPPAEPQGELRPGALVPVAFHVRDGGHGETGLRMSLSSWYFLHLREPWGCRSWPGFCSPC